MNNSACIYVSQVELSVVLSHFAVTLDYNVMVGYNQRHKAVVASESGTASRRLSEF